MTEPGDDPSPESTRRPIKARGNPLVGKLVALLLKTPLTPNQVSVASMLFAAIGAAALWFSPFNPWLHLVAVLGIQLRLLCNLIDGMLAVEGGRHSRVGALYNEFPDRIADTVLIVAAGHAAGWPILGWAGALAAALTAYVRTFGGALGQPQDFRGPMAKQHRMAVLTIASLGAMAEALANGTAYVLTAASFVILIGSIVTCATRTLAIARRLPAEATA